MLYKKVVPPQKIKLEESLILEGDSLEILRLLPSDSIQCVITSPPYWAFEITI